MHQPGSNVIQKKRVTSDPAQKLSFCHAENWVREEALNYPLE